jgi:phage-related protein
MSMGRTVWKVEFYEDARGQCQVQDFLNGLLPSEQAAVGHHLALLRDFGVLLTEPYVRHIDDDLWEIRPGRIRILYFAHTNRQFILVHAYYKKSNKMPLRELETARRRRADFLERDQG